MNDPTAYLINQAYDANPNVYASSVRSVGLRAAPGQFNEEKLLDSVKLSLAATSAKSYGDPYDRRDFLISEHWDSPSVNNGFVFVRASRLSLKVMLSYWRWMHYNTFGHDQSGFDAWLSHVDTKESCTPFFLGMRNRTQQLFYGRGRPVQTMSLNLNLFLSGQGTLLNPRSPPHWVTTPELMMPYIFHLTSADLKPKLRRMTGIMKGDRSFESDPIPYIDEIRSFNKPAYVGTPPGAETPLTRGAVLSYDEPHHSRTLKKMRKIDVLIPELLYDVLPEEIRKDLPEGPTSDDAATLGKSRPLLCRNVIRNPNARSVKPEDTEDTLPSITAP